MIYRLYDRIILEYPKTVLLFLFLLLSWLGYEARKLEIDASAETLLLEEDKDLKYTRLINERYGNPDYLFITYSPKKRGLFHDETLENIKQLREDLKKVTAVESVVTLLDVPLLESPILPVKEMVKEVRTLETPGTDRELARKELLTSPIYKNLFVSSDFKTTAIQVNLVDDVEFRNLLKRRNELKDKWKEGTISSSGLRELGEVKVKFKTHRDAMRLRQHETIRQVRAVMDKYRGEADLFLGGVAMVADDLISYIRKDLKTFGISVILLLMLTLWIIFRQKRWLLIPLLTCLASVIATCGLLGMFGWEVTVISSNFISLQIIITLSGTIHLVVRYRELLLKNPEGEQKKVLLHTITSIDKPSLYCVLTTMAGFSSLVLCNILPVIHFGYIMTLGIGISMLLIFLIFPTVLMLMEKRPPNLAFESRFVLTHRLSRFTESKKGYILLGALFLLALSIAGMKQLIVENSFIDYFKRKTEIYRGMSLIDRELGGTTPLDVVVDFPPEKEAAPVSAPASVKGGMEELDQFEEEFEAEKLKDQYWFTSYKMQEVEKIHDYLDSIPQTGKVMSLGTLLKVGKRLKEGEEFSDFDLALIYKELPERYRKMILTPYVSVEENEVRYAIRIRDSEKDLRRDELIRRIRREMTEKEGVEADRVHVTGLMVLYNNMLQSLFSSQIETLGAVLAVIMVMFMVLFRSLKIALIAICPSLLSVFSVLGFMGWAGIPLDMMTITIASISVGIAVDDTIHYIHRFRHEFRERGDRYIYIMHICHASIGYAMYYTSIVIIMGFSVLVISNFIPTVYFGLLTGVAMLFALLANLTLLAALIVFIRPFGPEGESRG